MKKLEELSGLIDFGSQVTEKGALQLRVGGVHVLDEDKASMMRAEIDDVNKSFNLRLDSGKMVESTGGKPGADIEKYENKIPEMREQLDEVASTLVNEFNAIHSQGFGLEDGNIHNFFEPSFTDAASIKVNDEIRANAAHIAASSADGEAGEWKNCLATGRPQK